MIFYSETLVSSKRHISELMVPGFGRQMQLLKGEVDRFRGVALYMREGFSAYRQRSYECGCCEVIVVRFCRSNRNFHVIGVYRNPDLSDKLFDCYLTAMAKVQSVDRSASFCALAV